jgi:predicted RNA-binding Zn-ribbon protein involved in translation (DUF1610 family)
MATHPCPKCGATMEEGFVPDCRRGSYSSPSQWVEGVPERSLLFGVKRGGKRNLTIATFRCSRCGYLESYARS